MDLTTKFVAQSAHEAFNTDLDYALIDGRLVHEYNIPLRMVIREIDRASDSFDAEE